MARLTFDHGINETEAIILTEAKEGWNFNLELGAKRLFPRDPIDLKGTVPNGGSVNGIMQLITRDNSSTTLIFGAATTPTIYSWTGANTSTAFTVERTANMATESMLRGTHWPLDDYLTITDIRKVTPLLNWDGTSVTRHKTNVFNGSPVSATLTCSGGTVSVTPASGSYSLGDLISIADANEADFNGEHEITNVVSAALFQYEITSCPTATATGTITVDVGTEIFAKYAVVHNGREWLFNITAGAVETPHMILASAFEDNESYDTVVRSGVATGNEAFYTLSPDLKPINGAWLFNKQLIISTVDGRLHRLAGLDASDYQFVTYFAGSAAIGEESGVDMGNDLIYMRRGGNIDLLSSTDTSGDVRADDISRYIPKTIHDLTGAITVYDQQHQKVLFFVGSKILVLFKDILATQAGSPWSIYKTQLTDSDGSIFDTKAATSLYRPGTTDHAIYFGDSDGNIWDLEGSGTGDNGTDIVVSRKTNLIEYSRLKIMRGYIQYRRFGEQNVSLIFDWSNEYNTTQSDIKLIGPDQTDAPNYYGGDVYYSGDFYYNEGFAFAEKVSKQNFSPAGRADGFFLTYYTETTVQFQTDFIELL